jgi:hypothetical protein
VSLINTCLETADDDRQRQLLDWPVVRLRDVFDVREEAHVEHRTGEAPAAAKQGGPLSGLAQRAPGAGASAAITLSLCSCHTSVCRGRSIFRTENKGKINKRLGSAEGAILAEEPGLWVSASSGACP